MHLRCFLLALSLRSGDARLALWRRKRQAVRNAGEANIVSNELVWRSTLKVKTVDKEEKRDCGQGKRKETGTKSKKGTAPIQKKNLTNTKYRKKKFSGGNSRKFVPSLVSPYLPPSSLYRETTETISRRRLRTYLAEGPHGLPHQRFQLGQWLRSQRQMSNLTLLYRYTRAYLLALLLFRF